MKRIIAFLLLTCILLLAGCQTEAPAETSSAESLEESSSESSEDTSSEGLPENVRFTTVSVGKSYTYGTVKPSENYPDRFGNQLTDGQKAFDIGAHYTDVHMVGYTGDIVVVVDLGEDGKRLSGASARGIDMDKDGVKIPNTLRVSGSDDGKTWQAIGRTNFTPTGDMTVSTARIVFEELCDYRYIRFRVTRKTGFIFLDELEVYADVDEPEEKADGAETVYTSEDIDRGAWEALSTGKTAKPTYSENHALYKTYTFEGCSFDERAPKNDKLLTDDDRTGRLFGEPVWVGLRGGSVKLDLKKSCENIYAVQIFALGKGFQVDLPDYLDIYGSADGKSFTLLGRAYSPGRGDHHTYTLLLPEYVKARYIKVSFPEGQTCWVEEISVLGGVSEAPETELYPPLNFPIVEEDVYWDATESDYATRQNLLLGLIQQVACSGYEPSHQLQADAKKRTDPDSPILTDGKLGNSQNMYCYSGEWFFITGGNAYEFIYDLGKLSTVDTVELSILEQTDWGIARPKSISVFLSDDGENWYEVYDFLRDNNVTMNKNATRLTFTCELETPYAARFVRFRIDGSATFIDELRAFGTKEVKKDTVRLESSGIRPVVYYTNPAREQYANSENTSVKADDIYLAFGNVDYGEGMKGLVAYLDEEGNAKDFYFDGFLYGLHGLPVQTNNKTYLNNVKSDWEELFNAAFNGAGGFDLLNQTVGEVKEELNRPDYKVYVYITMWCICETVTDFGDVDGDGVSENLSTAEGRKKVVDWYTAMCMDEFEARGYEHLVFDGFYWHGESIDWDNPSTPRCEDNSHIITEVSEYIHAKNTNLLWIPYYVANRYYQAYELGFDLVCMQPNYMFDLKSPLYRLDVTATRTKRQHLCVEIEHSYQALSDPLFVRNYMLYLYYGAITGYMEEATHIYYADLTNFVQMAYSDQPLARLQYDATYQFIQGTLKPTPDTVETLTFKGSKDTMLEGSLNQENGLYLYTPVSDAAHGYVVLASDGSFRYFPDKGFTGTDSFTYTYNNYMGESEVCTVKITVE